MRERVGIVHFPVITDFSIEQYGLFPGEDGDGLRHDFKPGVTVIAGVNGLGKTTSLNALFRVLVGPHDWTANNTEKGIGNLQHKLTSWKNKNYFSERVLDAAHNSTISATIHFNNDIISITRRLKDLSIVAFTHNDIPQANNHDHYQNIVCDLSGVGSFFDFYFVLKYLVFFLEERSSSAWDKKAMDGILRILFFSKGEATDFALLRDNIQKDDSEKRNVRAYGGKLKSKKAEVLKKTKSSAAIGRELGSIETELSALRQRSDELETEILKADSLRNEARQKHARAKLALEEKQRNHQELEQNYFSNIFPTIETIANYVLVGLDSGSGCLVCGSREVGLAERIHNKIQNGECPVCETSSEHHENIVPTQVVNSIRLDKAALEVEKERDELNKLNSEISNFSSEYKLLLQEQLDTNQKLYAVSEQEQVIKSKLPPTDEEVNRLERQIKDNDDYVKELKNKQVLLEDKLKGMLKNGSNKVKDISSQIEMHFNSYIKSFLAEKCELRFEPMIDSVANEAEKLEFPRFTVRMTSSTSPELPQPRHNRFSVSESQAEFVDLAFRMALIRTVSTSSPAMMILETPEASLDSIFIGKAGQLLNEFASDDRGAGNRLIVSSNLNKEDMIPALFGVPPEDEVKRWKKSSPNSPFRDIKHLVPREKREERIINLIRHAKESASIHQYREEYLYRFNQAVFPDWEKFLPNYVKSTSTDK